MAQTRFSGPVASDNGFACPAYTLATLPVNADSPNGTIIYVSDATFDTAPNHHW